ncbi:MAG: ArsR/SmtB family transcription factor [Dehalogenimonas sp.]
MKDLVEIFKSLSDGTRLRILNLLIERDCCVCEVVQALGISQTRASRNLSQLYDAGLLAQRREGLWVIYCLAPQTHNDHRDLIIRAVDQALKGNDQATSDRRCLRGSSRLCPPTNSNSLQPGNVPQVRNT